MAVNILCIGDLVGRAGRVVLAEHLPILIKQHQVDFVVCNGENAAGGSGITPSILDKLVKLGVDVVTLGDHCFRKSEILPVMDKSEHIIRPANLPQSTSGRGVTVAQSKSGRFPIAVTCILGQMNMGNSDSPWAAADKVLNTLGDDVKIRIIDFHAETTSEKIAMGWHCNGRASIVFGTHTHVPTADTTVLSGGTAFVCDLGMTGPYDSILGRQKDRVLKFLTSAVPQRFDMAGGDLRMYALLVSVDEQTGKALSAEQLLLRSKSLDDGAYDSNDGRPQHYRKKK